MTIRKSIKLQYLPFICDIHSHILPGVDDGFQSEQDALKILRQYQDDGIKHVVLSPHVDPGMYPKNNETYLTNRFHSFIENLPEDIHLKMYLSAEYMCDEQLQTNRQLLFLGETGVLIEMSYFYQYPYVKETIFALVNAGYQPILAHPERYIYLSKKLDAFDKFIDMECLFQLNLISLSGIYGPRSKIIMHYLFRHNMYSYTGSDVHSLRQYQRIRDIRVSYKLAAKIEELMNNNKQLLSLQ